MRETNQESKKNLKLGTNGFKIPAKEENCTTLYLKKITPLFCLFYLSTKIFIFITIETIYVFF